MPAEQLAIRVREVVVATEAYRRAVAACMGVGVSEATALAELLQNGPLPPSALVKRLGLTSPSVTALLDRLEVAGLVRRRRHPTDRRSILVELTAAGSSALGVAFEMFASDIAAAVAETSPDRVAELATLLGRIAESLRARVANPAEISRAVAPRCRPGSTPQPSLDPP